MTSRPLLPGEVFIMRTLLDRAYEPRWKEVDVEALRVSWSSWATQSRSSALWMPRLRFRTRLFQLQWRDGSAAHNRGQSPFEISAATAAKELPQLPNSAVNNPTRPQVWTDEELVWSHRWIYRLS